jgi:uncharacterized protein YbjT (DUF2867 family)
MILLLGATGSLGAKVLSRLIKNRWPVRVLSRGQSDWQSHYADNLKAQGVEVAYCDFDNSERLKEAFRGCTAVINAIGCLNSKDPLKMRAANLNTVERIAELVLECQIQRVIQVGCLGAREDSASEYLRLKWQADEKIMACPAHWTVVRPSYIFGEQFQFLELMKPLILFRPCLPVIGSGLNLIQPIWVEDVADCLILSLYDKNTVGQIYELGGPETLAMGQFFEMFRRQAGLSGPTVNIPFEASTRAGSMLAKVAPKQFLHPDLLQLATLDSASTRDDLKDKFGIKGSPISQFVSELAKLRS